MTLMLRLAIIMGLLLQPIASGLCGKAAGSCPAAKACCHAMKSCCSSKPWTGGEPVAPQAPSSQTDELSSFVPLAWPHADLTAAGRGVVWIPTSLVAAPQGVCPRSVICIWQT